MGKTAWSIVCLIGAIVMAAVSLVSALMGGCDMTVQLASGANTFMKCHWTFVAETYVGIAGVVVALVAMSCKDQSGRRASGVALLAVAAIAACLPASFGVGLCVDAAMHCHGTAVIVWALCACAAVIGIVQIAKSRPVDTPKR